MNGEMLAKEWMPMGHACDTNWEGKPRRFKGPIRLFIAAYPQPLAAGRMLEHLPEWCDVESRTPRELVHMTLLFIGDVDAQRVDWIAESVRRSTAGIGPMSLLGQRLVSQPAPGDPRQIVLETDAPAGLLELHRRLASRLSDPSRRGKPNFVPTFTLARHGHTIRAPRVQTSLVSSEPELVIELDRIALVQSVQLNERAEHRCVQTFELIG